MHHEANVWFIDAHAERHRRHHNLQVIALEFLLHISANIIFQPGMIGRRANSLALQARSGVFYFRTTITVNNPPTYRVVPVHNASTDRAV